MVRPDKKPHRLTRLNGHTHKHDLTMRALTFHIERIVPLPVSLDFVCALFCTAVHLVWV